MVTAKVSAPSFQMYDPSDLEKIFAQQMFAGKGLGGSAFAMLLGAGQDRGSDIARYEESLRNTNALQVGLAQQEMAADLQKEGMAKLADLVNAGVGVDAIPVIRSLYQNGQIDAQTAQASLQSVLKKAAEVGELQARAASHAAAGAPTYEHVYGTSEYGVNQNLFKEKSRDPSTFTHGPPAPPPPPYTAPPGSDIRGNTSTNTGYAPPGSVPLVQNPGGTPTSPPSVRTNRGGHKIPDTAY